MNPANGNGKFVSRQSALIIGSVDVVHLGSITASFKDRRANQFVHKFVLGQNELIKITCELKLNIMCIGSGRSIW